MKRLVLILFLLFAFNFMPVGNTNLYVRRRQTIEYTRGIHFRELDEADYIRDKITNFIRLEMLKQKLERINYCEQLAMSG
ncbi:MAG: hypothetical protein EHM58_17975 [Ignavibacteriae bacterium]|nr:MAG: hypothetical protein EHM58_17975 [Ignavibacteriota bacterium]